MLELPVAKLESGMRLARDVILRDGRILLLKGFTIKPRYIQKLEAYKVKTVFIEEVLVPIEKIDEERIYEDAFTNIKNVMESVRCGDIADIRILRDTVDEMVRYILNDDVVFMALTGIRDIDNYTFLHCVDVCIYSVITAKALNMTTDEIKEVAMAAILHDIGKCKIPLDILNKPDKLNDDEFFIIKNHAIYGMDIIKNTPGLTAKISKIVCQHHEKWDGSGYPLGLKNFDIDRSARIVSVADVYDALTANRIYRKRFMPHEAAEYLLAQSETHFDPKILKVFIDSIAVYPEGIVVMLNTGEIAKVLPAKGILSMRPRVSVITKKDGPPIFDPYEIDLKRNPTVFIVDIIS